MIKEVIVVEGRSDTTAVQRAVDADTIETGGSAVSEETLNRIRLAQKKRGVIVLTDPDYPGDRIRRIVSEAVPGCKHAFVPREAAIKKKNIGVENASPAIIRQALQDVKTQQDARFSEIEWSHLVEAGLTGRDDSGRRRKKMGENLGIGYGNAKQFYKRLRMFQISESTFQEAVRTLEKGEGSVE